MPATTSFALSIALIPKTQTMTPVIAPKLPKLILPSLTSDQVQLLIEHADNVRDKGIIALFTESGLRLSELTQIKPDDIDWEHRIIRVIGKGHKEAFAPFGDCSEHFLRLWFAQYQPNGGSSGTYGDTGHCRNKCIPTEISPNFYLRNMAGGRSIYS